MMYDVQTFMLEKEGLEDTKANRQKVDNELRVGGYKIYATVDPKIQETVQNTLSEYDGYPTKLPSGVETELTDSAGNVTEQPQSSAVVIDNSTGYLVAIVGSRDDPEVKRSLNRANTGLQVGSSIKPLAVYGPAFDTGYGAASPVANIPVPISGWIVDGEDSSPTITGTQGPVTMRTAIVKSLNVAAARTLMDYVTIDTSVEYLHKLGIPDENITPTGVGLAPVSYTHLHRFARFVLHLHAHVNECAAFIKLCHWPGNIVAAECTIVFVFARNCNIPAFFVATGYNTGAVISDIGNFSMMPVVILRRGEMCIRDRLRAAFQQPPLRE